MAGQRPPLADCVLPLRSRGRPRDAPLGVGIGRSRDWLLTVSAATGTSSVRTLWVQGGSTSDVRRSTEPGESSLISEPRVRKRDGWVVDSPAVSSPQIPHLAI